MDAPALGLVEPASVHFAIPMSRQSPNDEMKHVHCTIGVRRTAGGAPGWLTNADQCNHVIGQWLAAGGTFPLDWQSALVQANGAEFVLAFS